MSLTLAFAKKHPEYFLFVLSICRLQIFGDTCYVLLETLRSCLELREAKPKNGVEAPFQ